MAVKTRLGRDPLAGAAGTEKAKRSSPVSPQKARAKAGGAKTPVTGQGDPKSPAVKPAPPPSPPAEASRPDADAGVAAEPTILTAAAETGPCRGVPAPGDASVPEAEASPSVPPALPGAATAEAARANARAVGEAHAVVSATAPPPPGGPHPAEVFLRGVLEGLTQTGSLRIRVDVDPSTYALPVEKLFYFSHVLQLLVAPMETPTDSWRRPGDGGAPVATLTVGLAPLDGVRHRLRVYDNGLFFRGYLPEIGLEGEALRPLLLFVVKREGSILLRRGRAVEFEIIG